MRKYLSLAVVALSSGGALVAAAGAASAATATDHVAPWGSHAAPWSHHASDDNGTKDAICGLQKADYRVGEIDVKLEQKGCIVSGDWAEMPSVPGPPPVMGPPPTGGPVPCPEACVPPPHGKPTPPPPPVPCPPPVVKPPCPPPVPTPPPVPCPPPAPKPCPPGEDHGWSGKHHEAAPAAGNAIAGLPIIGGGIGGLL